MGGSASWGPWLATFCLWVMVGSMSRVCEWGSVHSASLGNSTGGAQVSRQIEARSKIGFYHHTPKPSPSLKLRDLQNLHSTCCLSGALAECLMKGAPILPHSHQESLCTPGRNIIWVLLSPPGHPALPDLSPSLLHPPGPLWMGQRQVTQQKGGNTALGGGAYLKCREIEGESGER